MACSALLETSALAAIAFFASTVADPEAVLDSEYINILRQHLDSGFLFSIQGFIVGTGIVMIILVISKNIIKSFVSYWVTRFGATLEIHFGKILLGGFLNMDYEWHLSRNSADLVMAMNWRTYFGRSFIMPILKLFNDLLMVIVMLLALLIVQPVISLIVLIVIGGTGAFIYGNIRRRLDKIARVARDYSLAINKEVTMAIHGVKDVKISKKESKFEKKFTDNAIPLARIVGLQQFFSGFPVFILETAGFIMLAVSIWLMMFFSGSSTAVITGTILRNSLPFIISQIKYVNQIENIAISSEQVKKPVMSAPIFENSIKFEKVSFSYNGTDIEVLRDLDFVIEKGETIGIIGTSGAGKSTLVELITGLFTPSKGRILVDGKVLTYIYDGTLAENVAFGSQGDEIDRDRVIECCNMASMQDFMDNMPNGIDSFIGERGVKLSGGQQQRVAIARALYDGPEIMIFDEATSSLDTRSEKAIQKTIYSFKGKQTLIVIAHRLSTVTDCDYLIWLENGRVMNCLKPTILN
jgi:ABC-type multidrug transport system fused ATPase/permease subunit